MLSRVEVRRSRRRPGVSSEAEHELRRGLLPGSHPSFEAPPAYGEYRRLAPAGASISADGSTVAWMGQDIGQQARAARRKKPASPDYTEPLWRRIEPRLGNAYTSG